METYTQLDENELEMRDKRMKNVTELIAIFTDHSTERMRDIRDKEKNLRSQVTRLTAILNKTDGLLKKSDNVKANRHREDLGGTCDKVRVTINDLNVELLRQRDMADGILSDYCSNLKGLIEL